MQALAEWASTRGVMRFADAAARDAAITSPDAGMVAWLDTPGSLTVRTASAWRTLWSSLAWTDLTLSSGYETYGSTPRAAVEVGQFITLRGGIQRNTSAQIATGSTIATIPSALGTPVSGDFPIAVQWSGDVPTGRLYVGADRTLQYIGDSTNWIALNGVRIPLA